jgi:hypothetical protein
VTSPAVNGITVALHDVVLWLVSVTNSAPVTVKDEAVREIALAAVMENASGETEDDEPSVHATPSRGTTKSAAAVLPKGKTLSAGIAMVTDETPFAIATVKEKTVGLVRERPDAVPPVISKSFNVKPVTGAEKVAVRGKFRPEAAPAINTTLDFTGLLLLLLLPLGKEKTMDPESVREPNTPIVVVTVALIVPAPDGTTITRHALL